MVTCATDPETHDPRLTDDVVALADFVSAAKRLLVLTGAGVSTASGIPDYRDTNGAWKRDPPILYRDFVDRPSARRRYWARSLIGWPAFARAVPNRGHRALAALEAAGRVHHLITQNIDGLHRRAGTRSLTELHGSLDTVRCLECGAREPRAAVQDRIRAANPGWEKHQAALAPDGDADLEIADFGEFRIPECRGCGGVLKPDVVFFGEAVPRARVAGAMARLAESDALLTAGTSLTVYSGYRFAREARRLGLPIAILNRGRTRADQEADLRINASCEIAISALADTVGR